MDNQPTDPHAEQGARRGARARPRSADLTALLGVVLIGVLVLILDGDEVSWLAGVTAGGAGAWLVLQRDARRPRRGAHGDTRPQRRTAVAVEPLASAGWRLLHDVRGLHTTCDHIAIGSGGVLVLQSMSPDGVVTMHGGELSVERRLDPDAAPRLERLRPRAVIDASAFRADVAQVTGRRLWVQAVVVIWSEFPAGCVVDGRCVYIHGSRLAAWLARRPTSSTRLRPTRWPPRSRPSWPATASSVLSHRG